MLDAVFSRIADAVAQRTGVACEVDAAGWPDVVVRLGSAAHRLRFQPSRPGQGAFRRTPRFDLSYERAPGTPDGLPPDQAMLLDAFLDEVVRAGDDLPAAVPPGAPAGDGDRLAIESLRPAERCNLRCGYCLYCLGSHGPTLTLAEAEARLQALCDRHPGGAAGIPLSITGGEPTLAPDLPAIVRRAVALGFRDLLLTTNAIRLADAAYADELHDAGVRRAEVSLRSFDEAAFDRITGTRGNFPRAMQGLRHAIERFDVLANLVINRHNYREVPAIVRQLSAWRVPGGHRLGFMPSVVLIEKTSEALEHRALWEDVCVPYATLIPPLAEAVRWDHAQPEPVVLNPLDGLCYAPPCAGRDFPELLAHVPTLPTATKALRVADPAHAAMPDGCRVKPPSCDACRFDAVCPGIPPGNALLFGFDELVPCR